MSVRSPGRGSSSRPPNRFESLFLEDDFDQLQDALEQVRKVKTEFLPDHSRKLICENDSPDIPFRYSINPYRGCEHGCAYCYARPGHEMLGMNAGIDFESKILVKYDAAESLAKELARPSWKGDVIVISGVTDCYQPAERRLEITRQCLEVFLRARQAIGIITKNALILRDIDLLAEMASMDLVHANISVTSLDKQLTRVMEPRTSAPEARLRSIEELGRAGIPVNVMVAPVVPGVTDHELPRILRAAKDAGARSAGYQLLRLPLTVAPLFVEWLQANYPLARSKVESLIRATRDGKLNEPRFGHRMRGEGPYAEGIKKTFSVFRERLGLDRGLPELDTTRFRSPASTADQLTLF